MWLPIYKQIGESGHAKLVVGDIREDGEPEGLLAVEMACHSRRGRDEIADVGRVESGEIALAKRRQHLRECLESHGVDRDANQV